MSFSYKAMHCLSCDKEIDFEVHDESRGPLDGWPEGAIIANTTGNYGSRVFDESGILTFFVCDGCLIKKSSKMFWQEFSKDIPRPAYHYFDQFLARRRHDEPI